MKMPKRHNRKFLEENCVRLILVSGFGMKIADQIGTFKKQRPFFCQLLKLRKFVNFVVLDLKCQSPFRYVYKVLS